LTENLIYGNPSLMKTTIEIPDSLYRQAKIRAVEKGTSLKALVLAALEHELRNSVQETEPKAPYFTRRKLLPEYEALLRAGAFQAGINSAEIISQDRDSR
jgi:hypothetical protein